VFKKHEIYKEFKGSGAISELKRLAKEASVEVEKTAGSDIFSAKGHVLGSEPVPGVRPGLVASSSPSVFSLPLPSFTLPKTIVADIFRFFALYFVTLFSFNAHSAASGSKFALKPEEVQRRKNQ